MIAMREKMFREALRIRMVEEKIAEIYPSDKIQSPVHLSIGQEHHIVAICAALKKSDEIYTTYRSHAPYLAKGGNMKLMFAELYGKRNGISKGKAGSMHLCAPETGLMGSSAIVGSVIPHAMGAAYSMKLRSEKSIAISITGDGSTEEGVFHECLNFSSLKGLPLLFVIENNKFAIHSHLYTRQSYILRELAGAYGIGYLRVEDGFDMELVCNETRRIREELLKKSRPFVLEIETYRYKAHVGVGDDFDKGYRKKREFEKWYARDPLVHEKKLIKKYRSGIEDEIDQAVAFAEQGSFPGQAELLEDVY